MPVPRSFTSHIWLSRHKRDQLSPGLDLRLSAAAISLGICLFAMLCGGLFVVLAAADRNGNGVSVAEVNLQAVRVAGYCLLGGGSAGAIFFGLSWMALVRMAHCRIRDQEHEMTRNCYKFPENHNRNGVTMDAVVANSAIWHGNGEQRTQQLPPVSEERLVL